jgi:DNA-binding protein HU-beta
MNKAELTEAVLKNLGKETTKKAAGDALEAVIAAIASGIKKDKLVQIIGFGTFKVSQRAARKGRNPKTGETIKIKASKSVRFSPSTALKGKL